MLRFILTILLAQFLVTGCIPVKQQETYAYNNSEFDAHYYNGSLLIYFGKRNDDKKFVIDDSLSHVIGPHGRKYTVSHDLHGKTPLRYNLYIHDEDNDKVNSLSNGIWKLHLVAYDKYGEKDIFETEFRIFYYYYFPLFEPPN